jgi:hypothetical protein
MFNSEDTTSVMTRDQYTTDRKAMLLDSYDDQVLPWGLSHRDAWKQVDERPFIFGTMVWTGFDYRGEPQPLSWPAAGSSFGIMDLCGFLKAAYWIRQAQWITNTRAYIVSSQGGTPRLLLPGEAGPETDANWSPDGRKIVFSTSREAGDDPKSVICILELDSNHVTTLPASVGMFSPRWSPDGHSIVTLNPKSLGLSIFDIRTQRWSTPYKGFAGFPRWSRGSHSIYFFCFFDNPGVFRIPVIGGDAERITDLKEVPYTGYYSVWFGLDPTDAPLLLRNIGTSDIYALTLEQK